MFHEAEFDRKLPPPLTCQMTQLFWISKKNLYVIDSILHIERHDKYNYNYDQVCSRCPQRDCCLITRSTHVGTDFYSSRAMPRTCFFLSATSPSMVRKLSYILTKHINTNNLTHGICISLSLLFILFYFGCRI